jgi:hypothetical protein
MNRVPSWEEKCISLWNVRMTQILNDDPRGTKFFPGWLKSDMLLYCQITIHNIRRKTKYGLIFSAKNGARLILRDENNEIIRWIVMR